ncbi:MAG: hypothetical protein QG556_1104 [Pseudomonadota bacterium]|nr:hypothetical protein [Pseudomonadota bacterium]
MLLTIIRVVILFLMLGNVFAYGLQTVSGSFHHILISGNIAAVKLHPTRGKTYMLVHGDKVDIDANEFFIEDGWLKAHVGEGYPKFGAITLDIWVHDLQTMNIKTSLPIQGQNLYSSGLSIYTMTSPDIHLSGQIALSNIRIGGRTRLDIEGVKANRLVLQMRQAAYARIQGNIDICHLDIRGHSYLNMHWLKTYLLKFTLADFANVQLAGQVQILDLDMYNYAKFGGRYLRVNRLFLKTSDFSEAQVSAVRSQHTYALDQSHIDYFNVPLMKSDFMVLNGETLDLREWSQRFAVNDSSFGD